MQWLLVHRALPVGTWLHKMGVSSNCGCCHLQEESNEHFLWACLKSQFVWKRLVRIFANYFPPSLFTLGIVVWPSLGHYVFHYDVESLDHAFRTCSGMVHVLPLVTSVFRKKETQLLWELLSSTTICYILRACCSLIFYQVRVSPIEVVRNIWLDMIHTLKGQWDCLIGDHEDKAAQHHVESYSTYILKG